MNAPLGVGAPSGAREECRSIGRSSVLKTIISRSGSELAQDPLTRSPKWFEVDRTLPRAAPLHGGTMWPPINRRTWGRRTQGCGPAADKTFARMTAGATPASLRNESRRYRRAAGKQTDPSLRLLLEAHALALALLAEGVERREAAHNAPTRRTAVPGATSRPSARASGLG
jgi:hypothetical protein